MKKIKFVLYGLILISVLCILFVFFLANRDLGTAELETLIRNELNDRFSCCLTTDEIKGNPFTGYSFKNISIHSEGEDLIHAEEILLQPDIFSLVKGGTALRNLVISGSRTDLDTFLKVLKRAGPGKGTEELSIKKITFIDSVLGSTLGRLDIEKGSIKAAEDKDHMSLFLKGYYNNLALTADGRFKAEDQNILFSEMVFSSGESTLEVSGSAGAITDIKGNIYTPDAGIISVFLPDTRGAGFKGGLNSSISISGKWPDLIIEGILKPDSFQVAKFVFDNGKAKWNYRNSELFISEIDSKAFGSPVNGSMYFKINDSSLPMKLDLHGTGLEVEKWYEPLEWLDFASGEISNIKVKLEGPLRALSGKVSFSSDKRMEMNGNPLDNVTADVSVSEGKQISFEGTGEWYEAPVKGNGTIAFHKNGHNNMDFSTRNLNVAKLSTDFYQIRNMGLQGNLSGNIHIEGNENGSSIKGVFRSEKVRTGKELLKNVKFTFDHSGKITRLVSLDASWKDSLLHATGKGENIITKDPKAVLEISVPQTPAFLPVSLENTKIKGTFEDSSFKVSALSGNLRGGKISLAGILDFNDNGNILIDLEGKCPGIEASSMMKDLGIPVDIEGMLFTDIAIKGRAEAPEIDLKINSDILDAGSLPVNDLKASLKIRDNILFLKGFKALIDSSPLKISGQVSIMKEMTGNMDLHATITDIDLEEWKEISGSEIPLSGTASADIRITGTTEDPSISMMARSPEVHIDGFAFNDMELEAINSTEKNGIISYLLTLNAGETPLEITGDIIRKQNGFKLTFDSRAKEVECSSFIDKVDHNLAGKIEGSLNYKLNGEISEGTLTGNATISSNSLSLNGVALRNINFPLSFNDGLLRSEKGRASLYGGKALFSGSINPESGKWNSSVKINGTDMELLTSALMDNGSISGTGNLEMELAGIIGKVYLLNGNGALKLNDGSIKGFDRLDKISDTGEIKFSSINAIYNVDGSDLYLMPGTRISAFPGDENYRFLSASGALGGKREPVDLNCRGELNVQALGGILGAMEGMLENAGDSKLILQSFLAGLVGGYTSSDFRSVQFQLNGTWQNPALQNLKIITDKEFNPIPAYDDDDNSQNLENIKFEVKFPTGEGIDNSASAGDQFKKQVMDNILKQIFTDEGSDDSGSQQNNGDNN